MSCSVAILCAGWDDEELAEGMIESVHAISPDWKIFFADGPFLQHPDALLSDWPNKQEMPAGVDVYYHASEPWPSEAQKRGFLLRKARMLGFDWMLTLDTDERLEGVLPIEFENRDLLALYSWLYLPGMEHVGAYYARAYRITPDLHFVEGYDSTMCFDRFDGEYIPLNKTASDEFHGAHHRTNDNWKQYTKTISKFLFAIRHDSHERDAARNHRDAIYMKRRMP